MIIFHVMGLVLSIGSIVFFLIIQKDIFRMKAEISKDVYSIIGKYQRMTHIGMLVMILSGGYLMTPLWSSFGSMHLLHVKVMAVSLWLIVMIILSIILRKAKTGESDKCDKRMVLMNYISLVFAMIVIVVAVLSFH